jgi:hypothetical protein
MQHQIKLPDHLLQQLTEMAAILIVLVYPTPLIAPGGNVIPSSGPFDPNRPRHARNSASLPRIVNC